jgi:hypothetical protein
MTELRTHRASAYCTEMHMMGIVRVGVMLASAGGQMAFQCNTALSGG